MSRLRLLVIEDGQEYITTLSRFLSQDFDMARAGDGGAALQALRETAYDVVFLDMRFDRVPAERLLGDLEQAAARCNGDRERGLRFLEDNQGTFVLAALREAGHTLPVVFSYDFDSEPRRFRNLSKRFGPLDYLTDNAGPDQIRAALSEAGTR